MLSEKKFGRNTTEDVSDSVPVNSCTDWISNLSEIARKEIRIAADGVG